MQEKDIQEALRIFFDNYQYLLCNSYIYAWESDFFAISKTGYAAEVEVKISKADFKKDFEKGKHFLFKNADKKLILEKNEQVKDDRYGYSFVEGKHYSNNIVEYDEVLKRSVYRHYPYCSVKWHKPETFFIPNKFYYACPEGLLTKQDMPAYAGLLWVASAGRTVKIKEAPFLHKHVESAKLNKILLDKFWFLSQKQRREYEWAKYQLSRIEQREDNIRSQLKTLSDAGAIT